MSFVYAGHEGRIIVATLAPLYFFFLHRGVRTGGVSAFAGAAATLGLALLSFQIQLAYYLIVAAAAWAAFAIVHLGVWRDRRHLAGRLALGLASVAFAFALASVNFLPFSGYVSQSPRGGAQGRGYAYSTSYSMPPGEIVGLAVPEQYGIDITNVNNGKAQFPPYHGKSPFKLHTEYAGAFVVALLFLGVLYSRRDRYWWFFAGLIIVALSVAFGGFTPLFRLYYAVMPGFKRFRAPNLTFFLVSFSLVTMAALTMERLAVLRAATETARKKVSRDPLTLVPWVLGGLIVLAIIGAALAGGATTAGPSRAAGWMRFTVFLAAVSLLLWLWLSGRLQAPTVAAVLSLVVVLDLWIIDRRFFMTIPPPAVTFAPDDVVRFLESQPGTFRVWAPNLEQQQRGASYRQGNYLMQFRIQQAGGEHGNQLQRWNEYVGTSRATYVDWHNFARYPVFMDAANVRYIITRAQLGGVPWKEVHRGNAGIVYENQAALPRAYLVGAVKVATPPEGALDTMKQAGFDPSRTAVLYRPLSEPLGGNPVQGTAQVTDYKPDHVEIHARTDRRALLVFADNYYEGWQTTVDGKAQPVLKVDHTFRGVVLEPGDHDIVMDFRPASFYIGFWIYLVGSALLLAYGLVLLVRYWLRRPREVPAPT
ncbi:MAG: YfhO family protein [Gemmatimonadota bacterium]